MVCIYRFGQFCLDCVNQTLTSNRIKSTLGPKQFAALEYLLRNAGRLVTKDELLDAAWTDVAVGDGVLKVSIAELRRLLDDTASPWPVLALRCANAWRECAWVSDPRSIAFPAWTADGSMSNR